MDFSIVFSNLAREGSSVFFQARGPKNVDFDITYFIYSFMVTPNICMKNVCKSCYTTILL